MSAASQKESPIPPEPPKRPRRRRRWLRRMGVLLVLLLMAAAGAIYVVQTRWFADKVRDRMVSEIEKASGGRSEIGFFDFDWKVLRASVSDFVLHGTEGPGEAPLLAAKRIEVGLGITSFIRAGVHVRSIKVEQPAFHVIAAEDGKTNIPSPKVKQSDRDFIDTLLELAASEIAVYNGSFNLNERRIPLDLLAHDVDVRLLYNRNRRKPIYYGDISSKEMKVEALHLGPMTFDFGASVAIERGTIAVTKATISTKNSKIDVSGFAYHLMNPSSDFGVNATVALSEFAGPLKIPIEHRGVVQFAGKVSLELKDKFRYSVEGRVKGRGLAIREGQVVLANVALDSQILANPSGVKAKRLLVSALGGEFTGSGELADFKRLTVDGALKNLATEKVQIAVGRQPLPYVSIANGPVHFEAQLDANGPTRAVLKTAVTLTAGVPERPQDIPVEGLVNLIWTQADGTIELKESHLATSASSIDLSGTLGRRVDVTAHTTRLGDVQVLLADPLPIQLQNGSADFQGTVAGPLEDPRVDGRATLTNFVYDQQAVNKVSAEFSLTHDRLEARSFSATQGALQVDGSGAIQLQNWKADDRSALIAKVGIRGARIETLLAELKQKQVPVTGSISIAANLHGSVAELAGDAKITGDTITAWDEEIERIMATVQVVPDRLEVVDGSAVFHKMEVPLHAVFTHKPGEWTSGSVSWNTKIQGLDVTRVHNFVERWPQWKATLNATVAGAGSIAPERGSAAPSAAGVTFKLTALNADATLAGLTYLDRVVGSGDLHAATSGSDLKLTANATIRGSRVKLNGDWKLENGYPGGGDVTASSVTVQTLRDLLLAGERAPLPFQSAVEASATFKMPLSDLNQLTADVKIQRLFIAPGASQRLGAGAKEQDLILENVKPVIVHVTPTSALVEKALFRATSTNIEVGGKIGLDGKTGFDLTVKGGLNLGQLQMFKQDLLASGTASVDAIVRGTLTDPQVNGSLTLAKASLYFGDLPMGLDNMNGSVSFDRNRATIQSLAAESGGGRMGLTGFVGFGGPALIYRLQGIAQAVRVRYPEGASTTVNANLNLTGTSEESLLAGTVTIVRAAFTPRSDLGTLMASLTKSGAAPIPQDNDYIRGMHLDVRLESEPNLEFQTSLTRGLQAEVDLRLRGTAARPSLLGDVAFSEGEISLFGNKYTLNRGDIRFFNPTRIEPVFDLEAETRARGIDVNISFSGTPSKLNASYRSDPPLQPSDIIALLAIGRDPNISAGLAASQMTQQAAGNGLGNVVGEAVASSLTNRLQKFFGVTKIKIDPQLTGLDNIPQARVTLEQQVSKDITLTFITNIARTSEQIVRVEWDLSREWSAIAVREENGLFGIDFQYKRRFK